MSKHTARDVRVALELSKLFNQLWEEFGRLQYLHEGAVGDYAVDGLNFVSRLVHDARAFGLEQEGKIEQAAYMRECGQGVATRIRSAFDSQAPQGG